MLCAGVASGRPECAHRSLGRLHSSLMMPVPQCCLATGFLAPRALPSMPKFAEDRRRVLARAEKARLGIFEVNGQVVELNSPPHNGRWDVDPVSGKRWHQGSAFAPLGEIPGDIRFPWELDRLHHLVWFGQAWRYTLSQHWADVGVNHLEQMLSEGAV